MNDLDRKQDLIKALGLTPVTTGNKTMDPSSYNNNSQTGQNVNTVRRRFSRRRKTIDGMSSHLFHFLKKDPVKTYKDGQGPSPRKKVTNNITTSSSLAMPTTTVGGSKVELVNKPNKLQPVQQSVVFLPNNPSPQGIVLGQTLFQGPDGKKFILVPSSRSQEKVNIQVSQSAPTILPVAGNIKLSSNPDVPSPNYVYVPTAQGGTKGVLKSFAYGSIVPTITNILPNSSFIVTATTSVVPTVSTCSQPTDQAIKPGQTNVIQLINVTRPSLQSQVSVNPANFNVLSQGNNQTFQLVKIQKKLPPVLKDTPDVVGSNVTISNCVSLTSSGINQPVLSTSNPSNPDLNKHTTPNYVLDGDVKAMPNAPTTNTFNADPHKKMSDSETPNAMALSTPKVVENLVKLNQETPVVIMPNSTCNKSQSVVSADVNKESGISNRKLQFAAEKEHKKSHERALHTPGGLLENLGKESLNSETNCIVVQGKNKRRKGKGKIYDSTHRRRYVGPPFTPCNAPPSPNTPGSSTCYLYEHTLLKMATRGFWGCEMGKLQDVFRSIRSESIDFDTMEDVTKRCYGFVRRKLLDAGDGKEAMYTYMKNYVDEFDSFLDRVYPVAIIAILIYLPKAADYSYVTWHGIPPTGWSEYRRAVVMREVFEVLYRFGTQFELIPEYRKEFFDNPVKSPLLIPRVFDLRKNYSDPPTCCVQKLPQMQNNTTKSETKQAEDSYNSETSILVDDDQGVFPVVSSDCKVDLNAETMGKESPCASESKQEINRIDGGTEKSLLITEQTTLNVSQQNNTGVNDYGNHKLENETAPENEAILISEPIQNDQSVIAKNVGTVTVENSSEQKDEVVHCDPGWASESNETQLMNLNNQSKYGHPEKPELNVSSPDRVTDRLDEKGAISVLNEEDRPMQLHEEVTEEPREEIQRNGNSSMPKTSVISASFAESIAAACGDKKLSNLMKGNSNLVITEKIDNQEMRSAQDGQLMHEERGSNANEAMLKGIAKRRRLSKRIANVTLKFDRYIHTSDDSKLDRDLKRALKLSKRDFTVNKRSSDQYGETTYADQITDRIPLRNVCPENDVKNEPEENEMNLPTLNRSVAFEALWTKKSVEEPIVILNDSTSYNLGEYLERFPIETHCPPPTTFIMACNEKYHARDILGYLRRGTQLVEQIGNEIVIDTTRTIKNNSIILAVRKVPPGKISKLVHPELHLDTYTGFLLPAGVNQPSKFKRTWTRSFKTKRKLMNFRDELLCKGEPESPSFIVRSHIGESEDSSASPTFSKKFISESVNGELNESKHCDVRDAEVQASSSDYVSTETQTDKEPNNSKLHDTDSIESSEEILNASIEKAISYCNTSRLNSTENHRNSFQNLADSYERAGKLLLNIANVLRIQQADDNGSK